MKEHVNREPSYVKTIVPLSMTLDMTVGTIDFMTAVLFLEDLIHPVLRRTKLAVQ